MAFSREHIVTAYEEELEDLRSKISELGGFVETAMQSSMKALISFDQSLAERVIREDQIANDMFQNIEEAAISIMARRQPMAKDLRMVISSIRMAKDLERIGDLAKNNAKRAQIIGDDMPPATLVRGLERVSLLAIHQVKRAMDSYIHSDSKAAMEVWSGDGEIDSVYTSLFREMLTYMMENPRYITPCTHLLFCAKNLERMGDHATNLAETVYFKVEGEYLEGPRTRNTFEISNLKDHLDGKDNPIK